MSRNLKRRRVDIAPRRPDPDRWLCRLSIEVSNACNVFPSGRGMPINGTFMPKERTDALTARSRVKNGILDLDHPPPYNPTAFRLNTDSNQTFLREQYKEFSRKAYHSAPIQANSE